MTAIDNYTVLETISDNERKAVYRCRAMDTENTVILKVLKSDYAGYEEVMRFKQEFKLLKELSGKVEGVIRPISLKEENGYFVMVLEDIGGKSLKRIMGEGRIDPEMILRLMIKIVEIIGSVHEHRVIHKDIKPSNIIWDKERDIVQLIDFDLAVKLSREKAEFQNSGVLEGSLLYISPEQTGRMNRSIDYRTDFYSLGVVLYELTTGAKPFEDRDILEMIYSIIAKSAVTPHDRTGGEVSRELSSVIMKLLEKSPEDRYRSAFGIKADLQRCLAGERGFEPAEDDRKNIFRISQRIYGREEELRSLKASFHASIREKPRLMLISGDAGVGKTAFVNELHPHISREKGLFTGGKFDQYNRNIPYSALIQAIRKLILQMDTGMSVQEKTALAEALNASLGGNGKIMTGIIPELSNLIGEQPEIEHLNPAEETNRFYQTFIRLLEGLIGDERPLVLFLDDLQWADHSTLQLLGKVVLSNRLRRLFIVCAYRQQETMQGHPLFEVLEEMEKNGGQVDRVILNALPQEAAAQLIADTLFTDTASVSPLSELIYSRTKGNSFFMTEILKELHKERLIHFDETKGIWAWELDRIGQLDISENIIGFLINKLRVLPEENLHTLRLAACIGSSFDYGMLAQISRENPVMIAKSLIRAVEEDLIFPADANYSLLSGLSEDLGMQAARIPVTFRFQHDRIQQALYQMIDPETGRQLHLTIGRLMLKALPPAEIDANIVDIVAHINKGLDYVEDMQEIDLIIGLNEQAALRAKAAFGYDAAFDFLQAARKLLPSSSWQPGEERTLALYRLFAECGYLTRHVEAADEACALLLAALKEPMAVGLIREMQANHYMYLGQMKESIEAGRKGLQTLGIQIPDKPGMGSVLKEFLKLKFRLRGLDIEDIFSKPEMTDERIRLVMRLLINIFPPAFISGETNLFAIVVLKKAELSLMYGNSPESAIAFIGYSILLSGFGDLQGAFDFGRLGIRINDKFNDVQWRGAALVLYTLFCHVWKEPWDTLKEWFGKSIESSLLIGEMMYLAHSCFYINLWDPSLEITANLRETERYLSIIETTKYQEALNTAKLSRQHLLNLAGELSDPLSFDGGDFREADFLHGLEEARYYSGIAIYYIYKMKQFFTFEHYHEALAFLEKADSYSGTLAGSAFMEEFSLYAFLNLAYAFNGMNTAAKIKAKRRMRKELRRMGKWAVHNPDTFLQLEWLMKAEWARINGKPLEAAKGYEQAVKLSEKGSFVRYKALCYELAAKFNMDLGYSDYASYLLKQSLYYYSVWGAKGKISQLNGAYPDAARHQKEFSFNRSVTETTESIDLSSILLASQAISKEIELDHLLEALMDIVIKNAGAQRGCIIMKSQSDLLIEGEYNARDNKISVLLHRNYTDADLPDSIIRYVEESKETIIYKDAFSESEFVNDRYLNTHRPKSLVCMPLINHNQVVAIIYLENQLLTGAFTRDRMKIINLLSREMVYALENASLYADLERSEEKYRTLVNNMLDGIFINQDRKLVFANHALARLTGYELEEMLNQPFHTFIYPGERERVEGYYRNRTKGIPVPDEYETRLAHKNGERDIYVIHKVSLIEYLGRPAVQGTVKDITERKLAEEELRTHKEHLEELVNERTRELELNNQELNRNIQLIEKLSVTDELTGVYNRRYFNTVFYEEVNRAKQNKGLLSFIMFDIDHYKKFNDTYGHYEGDNALRTLGKRLREYVRPLSDFVFRLGGEEFGVVASGLTSEESWELAEGIRSVVEELRIEHAMSKTSRYLTVSVGVATVQVDAMNENDIYKLADDALYQSKAGGRNRVTLLEH